MWNEALNKADWFFPTDLPPFFFQSVQQKEIYIKLQYALSAMLAGKTAQAETMIKYFHKKPVDDEIAYLINYDIQQLKQKHSQYDISTRLNSLQCLLIVPAKIQTKQIDPVNVPDISGKWVGKEGIQYFIKQFFDGTFSIKSSSYGAGKGEFIANMPNKFSFSLPGKGYGEYAVSSNGLVGRFGMKGTSQL